MPADVLIFKFRCQSELLRTLYHASDAVVANSTHEPFGLVGLDVMASGGVIFTGGTGGTGGTGEDYARYFFNSIALHTNDAQEISSYLDYLADHADVSARLRRVGQATAQQFTWPFVIDDLVELLESRARLRGALSRLYEVVLRHVSDAIHDPPQLDTISLGT